MKSQGSLLFELLLSLALFLFMVPTFSFLIETYQNQIAYFQLRIQAKRAAQTELDRAYNQLKNDFYIENIETKYPEGSLKGKIMIQFENDASRIIISSVSYKIKNKKYEIKFKRRITNPELALGKNTCSDHFKKTDFDNFKVNSANFSLDSKNKPTDIDIVGHYLFISLDGPTSTLPDLYIYDAHNHSNPAYLSSLNTGPGIQAIQVVGSLLYAANQSINSQLQVIDVADLKNPKLIKSIKLPGTYKDSTVVGRKILFNQNKLFLGTEKSSINEVHFFDVQNLSPEWKGSYELGSGVNALAHFHNKTVDSLYVANPLNPELIEIDTHNLNEPTKKGQFDAPSGSGNGKSLDIFGDQIALGRTIGDRGLYLLNLSDNLREISSINIEGSINDLINSAGYIFIATTNPKDIFQIYEVSTSTLNRINHTKVSSNLKIAALDCDKKSFFLLTEDPTSPLITIEL